MMTLASAPMGTVATVVNQGSPRQVQVSYKCNFVVTCSDCVE